MVGYTHKLEFKPYLGAPKQKRKNERKKDVTWFNPPFSLNVTTNVGEEFMKLVKQHFPN